MRMDGWSADHEQIELFPKRNFRCDCPTTSLGHHCTLKTPPTRPNADNVYGQNFRGGGLFCRCSINYDARLERETMVQCVSCEVSRILNFLFWGELMVDGRW